MTDNQRIAEEELLSYRDAKDEIDIIKQKLEMLEAKCERTTRSCDSIMKDSGRKDEKGNKVLVPVPVRVQSIGNAAEELIDELMEHRIYYLQKQSEAERLCRRLELLISERCTGIYCRVLSMFYLYNVNLERLAVMENFSYRQVRRVRWRALEAYGEKMSSYNL